MSRMFIQVVNLIEGRRKVILLVSGGTIVSCLLGVGRVAGWNLGKLVGLGLWVCV